jgi:hypothetical protein
LYTSAIVKKLPKANIRPNVGENSPNLVTLESSSLLKSWSRLGGAFHFICPSDYGPLDCNTSTYLARQGDQIGLHFSQKSRLLDFTKIVWVK